MLDESPISANLGNDRGFIIKEYSIHWYETFWESSKWTISCHCGKSCSSNMVSESCPQLSHLIVESRVHLTWYQSHVLNLATSSNPESCPKLNHGNRIL